MESNPEIVVFGAKQPETVTPGEVRGDQQMSFSAFLDSIQGLIDRVLVLAKQAENSFWTHRATALRSVLASENGTSDLLADCDAAAQTLCSAAYPMLNEIVQHMHTMSDISATFIPLGQATVENGAYTMDSPGDTVWTTIYDGQNPIGQPTRTFYLPTVKEVCNTLSLLVKQMREWADGSVGWKTSNSIDIRTIYGAALGEMYTRTRKVVNLLGPLWPPVICNYYPIVTEPEGIIGNEENFLPSQCLFIKRYTQYFELQIKSGPYVLPMDKLIANHSEWCNTPIETDGGQIFPSRGGIMSVEQMDVLVTDSSVDVSGVYEILAIQNEAEGSSLLLGNEKLISSNLDSIVLDDIYSTSFVLRLIRKAEPTDEKIHVQYRADMDMLDEDHFEQEFSWEFDDTGVNRHTTPLAKNSTEGLFVWKRYDSVSISGDTYQRNTRIDDIEYDTLFVGELTDALGINGDIRAFAQDGTYLYVGGTFDQVQGITIYNLARISIDSGSVDESWTPNPQRATYASASVYALAVDGSGNLFVGGNFYSLSGASRDNLAKFNSAGEIQTWDPSPNGYVFTLAVDGSDNLYVGGSFTSISSVFRYRLAKYLSTGTISTSTIVFNGTIRALAIDGSGNVYVGGGFTSVGGSSRTNMAKINSSMVLQTFDPAPNADVRSIAIDGDGNIYVGGDFTTIQSVSRQHLAKYDSLESIQAFAPNPDGTSIYAIATDGANNVFVAGDFSQIDGASRQNLAMFDDDEDLQALDPGVNSSVYSLLVLEKDTSEPPDGVTDETYILVGGAFVEPNMGAFSYYLDDNVIIPVPWGA